MAGVMISTSQILSVADPKTGLIKSALLFVY